MKDKISMPLIEAMLQYKSEDVYPLHTPGHKGGRGMQRLLRQELGGSVQMDVSLMSELDDIHEPETYIKKRKSWQRKPTAVMPAFGQSTARARQFMPCC